MPNSGCPAARSPTTEGVELPPGHRARARVLGLEGLLDGHDETSAHLDAETRLSVLREHDDTVFGDAADTFERVLREEGFEPLGERQFGARHAERLCWWWADGLLVEFDTWGQTHINAASLHTLVVPHADGRAALARLGEGGIVRMGEQRAWAGTCPCAQGLRFLVHEVRRHGTPLTSWPCRPRHFLLLDREERAATRDAHPDPFRWWWAWGVAHRERAHLAGGLLGVLASLPAPDDPAAATLPAHGG